MLCKRLREAVCFSVCKEGAAREETWMAGIGEVSTVNLRLADRFKRTIALGPGGGDSKRDQQHETPIRKRTLEQTGG